MPNESLHHPAIPSAKPERNQEHALGKVQENGWFNTTVIVTFKHYRKRLIDRDNLDCKAILDAVVRSGILGDDSPKEIKDVRHEQFKVEKGQKEYTVVVVEEV